MRERKACAGGMPVRPVVGKEMHEAAKVYQFSWWQRFIEIELPFAAIGLVWNSMMSVAGGWFFLMACEMFVLGSRDFRLPGLGSYLQTAASAGDTQAIFWGVGVMIAVIVLLDQIVWRPVIAWAEKFKMEQVESADVPHSWFLNVIQGSRGLIRLRKRVIRPLQERLAMHFVRQHDSAEDAPPVPWRVWTGRAIAAIVVVAVLYAVTRAIAMLTGLDGSEYRELLTGAGATFLRVVAALVIGAAWTIPAGVAIGFNPKLARAVDDADDGKRDDPRSVAPRLVGKESQIEAQQAVGAHLQQHTCQQHRTRSGSFHVRVGQPGVQREQRHLHGEGDKEAEEQPERGVLESCHLARLNLALDVDEIKCSGLGVQPDHRRQHKHRRDHGVQEELHGSVNFPSMPVHADDQRHGNQRGFPEEIEEEQVERNEDADHRGLEHRHKDEKFLHPVADGVPRDEHAHRHQEGGQDDQPHGDAIDAKVIVDVGVGNPGDVLLELEPALPADQVPRQVQRGEQGDQRDRQRKIADIAIAARKEQQQDGSRQRQKNNDGEDVAVDEIHRTPLHTMKAITAAAPMATQPA